LTIIGVSSRLKMKRRRLRLGDRRADQAGWGFIVRTVSEGKSEEDLVADLHYLTKLSVGDPEEEGEGACPHLNPR